MSAEASELEIEMLFICLKRKIKIHAVTVLDVTNTKRNISMSILLAWVKSFAQNQMRIIQSKRTRF